MSDVYCPYCDAGIDINDPNGHYLNNKERHKCPECGRIFMLKGRLIHKYYAETAEETFDCRIENVKNSIKYYQKMIEDKPEKAKLAKTAITKYQKTLDKYESEFAKIREHNSSIDMRSEENEYIRSNRTFKK